MLPGDYDQHADVRHLDTYAIVNGVRREIQSVSLDREMANDLPDQVAGGSGLSGGSGTIVWAVQDVSGVEPRETSPWHVVAGWPPQPGDQVRVYVTDGTTSWPRFTGRIDKTSGTVTSGLRSSVVDTRDDMNSIFTREPLLRHHVPLNNGTPYRYMGLDAWFIMSLALRRVHIYNTIPAGNRAALSATMQGSVWSHIGALVEAYGPSSGTWPRLHRAPWGWCVGAMTAEYLPWSGANFTFNSVVQISLMVAEDHHGDAHVRVYYGNDPDRRIRVRVWPDRRVSVYHYNTLVADMSSTQMQGATSVAVLIKGSTWTIRNDAGREATGSHARTSTTQMSRIEIHGTEGARFAGVVVNNPTPAEEFRAASFAPNMTFEPSALVGSMEMSPRLENRDVASEVDEICKATLTASWFDETGVLRMVPADRLRIRESVQTVTTLDDVTGLQWQTSLLALRSLVNVTWKRAVVSRTQRQRKDLYRGSKQTLESGDEVEVFATPANDVEWFGVDRNPSRLDDTNWGAYNQGVGSFVGVYYVDEDGEELPTSSRTTTISTEELGYSTIKVTHTAGSYGSNVEANLGTSENATALRSHRQGEALPVIRGRGEGQWIDEVTTSAITGSRLPDGGTAPELTHDLGPWGRDLSAQRVADFLAERVTRVEPTLESLRVTYDPRRQLGDVITIEAGILDVTITALIVGISENHNPGDHEQSLTVRIINAASTRRVTYTELEQAWAGGDYTGLQAVWTNLTYEDFTDTPLEGAPNG